MFIFSPVGGHSDCFQLLVIIGNAAVSVCIQVFMRTSGSSVLVKYLGVELLGCMVSVCLTFKNCQTFSKVAIPFYIPIVMSQNASYSPS